MNPADYAVACRDAEIEAQEAAAALTRLTVDWRGMAFGYPITVEKIGGAYYGFGEELAVLRIFACYNANGAVWNKKARVGKSHTKGWFFCLET